MYFNFYLLLSQASRGTSPKLAQHHCSYKYVSVSSFCKVINIELFQGCNKLRMVNPPNLEEGLLMYKRVKYKKRFCFWPVFFLSFHSHFFKYSQYTFQVDNRLSLSVTLDQGDYCREQGIDAQDPPCGRVILSGSSVPLEKGSVEYEFAKESMFYKHPGMAYWPEDHGFYFAKLNVEHVILLAGFGGANEVPVEDYFAAILD